MAQQTQSLGEFSVGTYVMHVIYPRYGRGRMQQAYGRVVEIDIERSVVVWCRIGSTYRIETKYPVPKSGDNSHWFLSTIQESDVPKTW